MLAISGGEFRQLLSPSLRNVHRSAAAVSGGADSIALALLLQECLSSNPEQRLYAFTVDHAMRPESAVEAQNVHAVLTDRGIHHEILEIPQLQNRSEKKARIARYSALSHACIKHNITDIYMAHHANDQAETVLLRLLSGSGWQGLTGMQSCAYNPVSSLIYDAHRIRVHRPLLSIPKARLTATCKARQMPWFEDATNADPKYTMRNAIRQVFRDQESLPHQLREPQLLHLSVELSERLDNFRVAKAAIARRVDLVLCQMSCSLSFEVDPILESCYSRALQMSFLEDVCRIVSPTEQVNNMAMKAVLQLLQRRQEYDHKEVQITAGGVIWRCHSGRCSLSRQAYSRDQGDEATVVVRHNEASAGKAHVLFDRRYYLLFEKLQETLIVRNLRKSDMVALRAAAQLFERNADLDRILNHVKGPVRFTLPAVFSKASGQLLALPSAELAFDSGFACKCSLANAHLWDRMLESARLSG